MQQLNNRHINEYSFTALLNALRDEPIKKGNRKAIKKVKMIPKNVNVCKIYSDGKSVYAAVNFYEGDIVEICPAKSVTKAALYDNDIRKIVFEVNKDHTYVIPFGYCQYYELADELHPGNVDYLWDPNMQTIVIKAIRNINVGEKLILTA